MKGSRRCKNTKVVQRICLSSDEEADEDKADEEKIEEIEREVNNMTLNEDNGTDYEDVNNWSKEEPEQEDQEQPRTEITIKQIASKRNIVKVKVGEKDTEMYADSGADVNVAPHTWYRKEMGILQSCNLTLSPYGTEEQQPVEGRFKNTITTEKGLQKEIWIHILKADQHFQPLLGDIDATV